MLRITWILYSLLFPMILTSPFVVAFFFHTKRQHPCPSWMQINRRSWISQPSSLVRVSITSVSVQIQKEMRMNDYGVRICIYWRFPKRDMCLFLFKSMVLRSISCYRNNYGLYVKVNIKIDNGCVYLQLYPLYVIENKTKYPLDISLCNTIHVWWFDCLRMYSRVWMIRYCILMSHPQVLIRLRS